MGFRSVMAIAVFGILAVRVYANFSPGEADHCVQVGNTTLYNCADAKSVAYRAAAHPHPFANLSSVADSLRQAAVHVDMARSSGDRQDMELAQDQAVKALARINMALLSSH